MTGNGNGQNVQSDKNITAGGPSEDLRRTVRKGQIDWVTGITKPAEFRS